MHAAVEIPKLCATDMLEAFGSCRLCLVEIDGRGGTPASCTTPVAAGLVVHTQTERLDRIRKGVMELYLSDHSVDSLDRSKHPYVDLLDSAEEVGLKEVRYGFDGVRHPLPQFAVARLFKRGQNADERPEAVVDHRHIRKRPIRRDGPPRGHIEEKVRAAHIPRPFLQLKTKPIDFLIEEPLRIHIGCEQPALAAVGIDPGPLGIGNQLK